MLKAAELGRCIKSSVEKHRIADLSFSLPRNFAGKFSENFSVLFIFKRILIAFSFFFLFAETNVKKATTVSATAASAKLTNNSIKGTMIIDNDIAQRQVKSRRRNAISCNF